MTEFGEFMQALRSSANARDLLGTSQPASEEEAVGIYVAAAKELGFDLSAEEIVEGMRALAEERFARTERAEAVVIEERFNLPSRHTFQDGEAHLHEQVSTQWLRNYVHRNRGRAEGPLQFG